MDNHVHMLFTPPCRDYASRIQTVVSELVTVFARPRSEPGSVVPALPFDFQITTI